MSHLAFPLFLAAATTGLSFADTMGQEPAEAEGHTRLVLPTTQKIESARFTFSERFGLDAAAPRQIVFPAVDVAQLMHEDDMAYLDGERRLRVATPHFHTLRPRDGSWQRVPNGWLWRVDISCEDALGVNLHFTDMQLPEGAELIVYDPSRPGEYTGPFTDNGDFDTGEAWTTCLGSDVARIEYFIPRSVAKRRPQSLPFELADIMHVYRDFFRDGGGRGAGSCHNDPACYAEWTDTSYSVARILVANSSLCSGQLIATIANDETPYYYTANHCISTSSEANSTTFLFRYMRTTCSGGVSSGTTISGGADLVSANSNAQDGNTLVMIRRELTGTLHWNGWTMASIGSGTNSTSLHHPDGDYMRISFGDKINGDSYLYGMDWTPSDGHGDGGVTEPGSSGSGIFRDSDNKIYGSLCCGSSSCSNTNGYDYYNRLNVSGFTTYLTAGTDDTYEDNDTCGSAVVLANGTHSNLVVKSTDSDWYHFALPNGGTMTGTATFTDANGDIDLRIYRGCNGDDGGSLVAFSQTNGNSETFNYTNTSGQSEDYYLWIYLDHGQRNTYSLTVTADEPPTGPAHDLCDGALPMVAGSNAFDTTDGESDGYDESGGCTAGGTSVASDVWYSFTADCSGQMIVTISGDNLFEPKAAIYASSCPSGPNEAVACLSDETGNAATLDVTEGDNFYLRIGSADGTTGEGSTMIICVPGEDCPGDCADSNGEVDVNDLLALIGAWGSSGDCDVDGSGEINVSDLLELISAWGVCP